MPGTFIEVKVDATTAANPDLARQLRESCPVDIFAQREDGQLRIVEENLDECVLCDLCKKIGPKGAVQVIKLYET